MPTTFHGLAYDAFDAQLAAHFWGAALRLDVAPGATPEYAELVDGSAFGVPHLVFRQIRDGRVLRTPLHLQLTTTDLDGEWHYGPEGEGPVVSGPAGALAWWLTGRGAGEGLTSSTNELPEMEAW